jgi:hypothetical protein
MKFGIGASNKICRRNLFSVRIDQNVTQIFMTLDSNFEFLKKRTVMQKICNFMPLWLLELTRNRKGETGKKNPVEIRTDNLPNPEFRASPPRQPVQYIRVLTLAIWWAGMKVI